MPSIATTTTVAQVLDGLRLAAPGKCRCQCCGRELHDGHPVTVYAYQRAEEDRWHPARVYCLDCDYEQIGTPTLGASEVVARACLGCIALAAAQAHRLALTAVDVVDYSPPDEGTRP